MFAAPYPREGGDRLGVEAERHEAAGRHAGRKPPCCSCATNDWVYSYFGCAGLPKHLISVAGRSWSIRHQWQITPILSGGSQTDKIYIVCAILRVSCHRTRLQGHPRLIQDLPSRCARGRRAEVLLAMCARCGLALAISLNATRSAYCPQFPGTRPWPRLATARAWWPAPASGPCQ